MCDICDSAEKELREFAEQLVEKFPAVNKPLDEGVIAPRIHHVWIALTNVAHEYYVREAAEVRQQIHEKQAAAGRGPVFMTREGKA